MVTSFSAVKMFHFGIHAKSKVLLGQYGLNLNLPNSISFPLCTVYDCHIARFQRVGDVWRGGGTAYDVAIPIDILCSFYAVYVISAHFEVHILSEVNVMKDFHTTRLCLLNY